MIQNFLISFVLVSIGYAFIGSSAKFFYKDKPLSQLSRIERDILYDRVKFSDRLKLFFLNIAGSPVAPQIYILAILLTLFVYIIKLIV